MVEMNQRGGVLMAKTARTAAAVRAGYLELPWRRPGFTTERDRAS